MSIVLLQRVTSLRRRVQARRRCCDISVASCLETTAGAIVQGAADRWGRSLQCAIALLWMCAKNNLPFVKTATVCAHNSRTCCKQATAKTRLSAVSTVFSLQYSQHVSRTKLPARHTRHQAPSCIEQSSPYTVTGHAVSDTTRRTVNTDLKLIVTLRNHHTI